MNNTHAAVLIAVMAAVTFFLRIIPFAVFSNKRTSPYIDFLGKYLPYSVMAMLVVYCLKNISFVKSPYAVPEVISVAVAVGLHIWKRNTLLSIVCATACYMILIRVCL